LQRKQAEKEAQDIEEEPVIDSEEYELIKRLKDMKSGYREAFEVHRDLKMETVHIEHKIQSCKAQLVNSFEDWYEKKYGHLIAKQAGEDGGGGETMDSQEQFDLLEAERLEQQHPDALAFYKARKTATRNIREKGHMTATASRGR